jgi:hypothetical protein
MCRCELVRDATPDDPEAIVGDECHIVARKPTAARGDGTATEDELDQAENLILLCKVHHKLVDDKPKTHPSDMLLATKAAHEKWVRESLTPVEPTQDQPRPTFLDRAASGGQVMAVAGGAYAYWLSYDDPQNGEEVKLLGSFVQNIHDWGAMWSELEPRQRMEGEFQLTAEMKTLDAAGFSVFVGTKRYKLRNDKFQDVWPVAIVYVARAGNPAITPTGQLGLLLPKETRFC